MRNQTVIDTLIPAKTAVAFEITKGQIIRIIDPEGQQVGDFVAFNKENLKERFSQAQTRKINRSILVRTGSALCSNICSTMFTVVEDRVGRHDLQYSPCGPQDYAILFGVTDHPSCKENLAKALTPYGIDPFDIPAPLNVFMHTKIEEDGSLICLEPLSKPGDYIDLRAEMSCLVGLSACPQDLTPCNAYKPTALEFKILQA